jgi:hypothetical protein
MSLVLGKNHLTRAQLENCKTPAGTDKFVPISHFFLANLVAASLVDAGFKIEEEDHVTNRDDLRYFGGFSLTRSDLAGSDRRIVCGVRNSNDKSFAAAICIGTHMIVCENLCFSAEKQLARRHTKNVLRDLPSVVSQVIAGLVAEWNTMGERIEVYQNWELTEAEASKLIIRLVDHSALPKQKCYDAVQVWRDPALAAVGMIDKDSFIFQETNEDGLLVDAFDQAGYDEALAAKSASLEAAFGKGENLWGLYNAVTECLKGSDIHKLPTRTMKLQALFDGTVGFNKVVGEAIQEEQSDDDEGNFQDSFAPEVDENSDTEDWQETVEFEID